MFFLGGGVILTGIFFPPAITGEGLQNAIYSRLLWPMSIEGSLACHAIFDTGHPFIIDISSLGTCDTCSEGMTVEMSLYLFLRPGIEHRSLASEANALPELLLPRSGVHVVWLGDIVKMYLIFRLYQCSFNSGLNGW